MVSSIPFLHPVQFTGNGVISQGRFFPYKFVNTDSGYPQVDCFNPENYLALYKVHLVMGNTAATAGSTLILEGEKNGISQYLSVWLILPNIAAYYNFDREYKIVMDKGTSLVWSLPVAPMAQCGVIFQYAEIDGWQEQLDYPVEKKKNCGIIDWLQGECIKNGSIG